MIRSETMQAKQWKALGKNSYDWLLGPGSVFLPRAGDSRAVGLGQRCEEQRGSPGLSTERLSKQWRHAGHFLAMLPAVHLLSLSPGTLVHNPSSASRGHCDWLLNECISHLEKNCLLPQSVAISWLFESCPSDCSSISMVLRYRAGPDSPPSSTISFLFSIPCPWKSLGAACRYHYPPWQRTSVLLLHVCQPAVPECQPHAHLQNEGCSVKWLGVYGFLVWGLLFEE